MTEENKVPCPRCGSENVSNIGWSQKPLRCNKCLYRFIDKNKVHCPLCQSTRLRVVYTDDEMTTVDFYDCTICSVVFTVDGNTYTLRSGVTIPFDRE